jgi:hypothetical protein
LKTAQRCARRPARKRPTCSFLAPARGAEAARGPRVRGLLTRPARPVLGALALAACPAPGNLGLGRDSSPPPGLKGAPFARMRSAPLVLIRRLSGFFGGNKNPSRCLAPAKTLAISSFLPASVLLNSKQVAVTLCDGGGARGTRSVRRRGGWKVRVTPRRVPPPARAAPCHLCFLFSPFSLP